MNGIHSRDEEDFVGLVEFEDCVESVDKTTSCTQPTPIPTTGPELDENQVREQAYYRWLDATNGQPVSQEETDKFWLETEDWLKRLKADQ